MQKSKHPRSTVQIRRSGLEVGPLLLAFTFAALTVPAAQGPFTLLHSLFDPDTNAQAGTLQGQSVGVDGNIVVTGGAPGADLGSGDSGVVKVYDATTGGLLHTLANPSPTVADFFGSSLAISGTRVVVGAMWNDTGANNAGSAYVYDLASATPTMPVFTLTNPSPAADDRFGGSVAISGTWVVVAAVWDDTGAGDSGSAYVYDLASATPTVPVLTLTNPSPAEGDQFGSTVAISGTRVVVGANADDTGAPEAGSAYVYDLTSPTPSVPMLTLTNPSPAQLDSFGPVAIFGTRVVVGAIGDDTGATDAGIVYVYDLASVTPTMPMLTLTNPSPAVIDYFGISVSISGARVVVGALYDDTGAVNAGIAYVFDLASATPTVPVATLTNLSPAVGDLFGFSVSISGTKVVVGVPGDDTRAADAGSAYVYDVAGATPTLPATTLNQPSPATGDQFGNSVAISGARLVVGAIYDNTGAVQAGSAHVYDLASATPTVPVATLTNPTPAQADGFGGSVAISGTWVVVGALWDDTGDEDEEDSGSAYVYDLASATPTVPVFTLTNPNPTSDAEFGGSMAISGTRVVIGANGDHTGAIAAGIAYVYDLANATPTVPVITLTNPSPAEYDIFGIDVAISGTRVVVGAAGDHTGANRAGSAYVYDLAGAAPTVPVLTLTNPSPAADDRFGGSVAISGTWLVVGAVRDDTGAGDSGSAYVYDLASATPTVPVLTLTNPSPAVGDQFGSTVAISGTRVVVGANADDTGAPEAGSAYVYDLASATPTVPVATLNNPTSALDDRFGLSVAIDGTTIVVGTPFNDTNAKDRGAAYVFGLRPELGIAPAAPGLATLSWASALSSGFVLQYTETFSPTNWLNALTGATNPVTISTTNSSRFYRLSQP